MFLSIKDLIILSGQGIVLPIIYSERIKNEDGNLCIRLLLKI